MGAAQKQDKAEKNNNRWRESVDAGLSPIIKLTMFETIDVDPDGKKFDRVCD